MRNPTESILYPNLETLPAIPLALMILARTVSTPSMTFSQLAATRLPAYIDKLRKDGWGKSILVGDLPLTPKQRLRRHSKPFAQYWLEPSVIVLADEAAQEWAERVLRLHHVNVEAFPFSKDWLEYVGGEK